MNGLGRAAAVFVLLVLVGCGTTTTSSSSSAAGTGTPSATAAPTVTPSPTLDVPPGWVAYHSSVNHVSFFHPANWKPCEFADAVTVVDNPTAQCPTHAEGPSGTVTITSDTTPPVYSMAGIETPVTVAGIPGKCFTDTVTTPPPLDFGYRTTIVCEVRTAARTYLLEFYGIPVATNPNATTQAQFSLFLQTVTFDD
jgi:hypothetical protein